jgi:uncharacterized protein (DUF2236 family)
MAVAQRVASPLAGRPPTEIPAELYEVFSGFAYALAAANVVMQLSRLPVGRAVALSKVESGRVDRHPIKRLRTTSAFLAVAAFGTEEEMLAMRAEINRQHAGVRSGPDDPVRYDAFDAELQLWVAACLYRGTEDMYRLLHPHPREDALDAVYEHGKRMGTLLQVPYELWPTDRAAFEAYWRAGVAQIEMDDVTRRYLQYVAGGEFFWAPLGALGRPPARLLRPFGRLLTVGFLPQEFRDELGLPWDARRQRAFDAIVTPAAAVTRRLPRPLREFPFNVYLWDTRRRITRGRAIV